MIAFKKRLFIIAFSAFCALAVLGCGSYGVSGTSEIEPNNEIRLADRVSGLEINGVIGVPGDVDWFVLAGQEGVAPTFTIYHDPSVDIDFEVYDLSYNILTRVGVALGTNSGDTIRVNTPGVVYIRVWAHSGLGPYRIQIIP